MKAKEWLAAIIAFVVCAFAPIAGIWWIPTPQLGIIETTLSACLTLISTVQIIEAIASLFYKEDTYYEDHLENKVSATLIISAYLPNEQFIIMNTLKYYENIIYELKDEMGEVSRGFNVVLGYNTPVDLPVEETLRLYEELHDWFQAVRVPNSRSKAANINYVLDNVENLGDMIGLYDADHHPYNDVIDRANHWLNEKKYDYVQGRCVIRSEEFSLLETWTVFNFELMYTLQHKARNVLWGYALFGGTNGFWRREVIQDVKFRTDMLTEDIDCSIRAITKGYKGIYDRMMMSSEEAPPTKTALWKQRIRWSQGWFEVFLLRFFPLIFNRKVNARNRLGFTLLFPMRELWNYVQILSLPCTIVMGVRNQTFDATYLIVIFGLYDFMLYPFQALMMFILSRNLWETIGWCKMLCISISNFLYVWVETYMSIYCHFRTLFRINKWVVTKRGGT